MAFIYEYIRQLDVSKLSAGELAECLLYLHHIAKHNLEIEQKSMEVRQQLQARLLELREAKRGASGLSAD